jgi:hypothetical protein
MIIGHGQYRLLLPLPSVASSLLGLLQTWTFCVLRAIDTYCKSVTGVGKFIHNSYVVP